MWIFNVFVIWVVWVFEEFLYGSVIFVCSEAVECFSSCCSSQVSRIAGDFCRLCQDKSGNGNSMFGISREENDLMWESGRGAECYRFKNIHFLTLKPGLCWQNMFCQLAHMQCFWIVFKDTHGSLGYKNISTGFIKIC